MSAQLNGLLGGRSWFEEAGHTIVLSSLSRCFLDALGGQLPLAMLFHLNAAALPRA